jgi:hypothetical protein
MMRPTLDCGRQMDVVIGCGAWALKGTRPLSAITRRPEFEPPWIGNPHITALSLSRLGDRETAAIIDGLTGNTPLPESIRQDIAERSLRR